MRTVLALILLVFAAVAAQPAAMAQTSTQPAAEQAAPPVKIDRKKLLVQPRNKDGTLVQVNFLDDPVLWAREKQQAFYGKLSATLRLMKGSSPAAATWTLVLLSFGYGVFHAAGPGHGKAVISAWLLATENELKRGVLISFLSAIHPGAHGHNAGGRAVPGGGERRRHGAQCGWPSRNAQAMP